MTCHLPFLIFSLACGAYGSSWLTNPSLGSQAVNFWRLDRQGTSRSEFPSHKVITIQDGNRLTESNSWDLESSNKLALAEFEPQWFEQPLDHFDKSNTHTFQQRYWVNKRHYQPRVGAPVIVLDGGETSGEVRSSCSVQYLLIGFHEGPIAFSRYWYCWYPHKCYRRTGCCLGTPLLWWALWTYAGSSSSLRWLGESIAVQNLTTDSLRYVSWLWSPNSVIYNHYSWLNNEQAAADSANFMANVQFSGIDADLTAPGTPWIYYGVGSARSRLVSVSDHMSKLPGLLCRRSCGAYENSLSRTGLGIYCI